METIPKNRYEEEAINFRKIANVCFGETKDYILRKAKVFELLAKCDSDDEIFEIFDTGTFNQVVIAYCERAMKNCEVDNYVVDRVIGELKRLLDNYKAREIFKRENK